MQVLAPQNAKDRFEVYRFFNGVSQESTEAADRRTARVPLVKTFLIEHAADRCNKRAKAPAEIFSQLGVGVRQIDDTFMSATCTVVDPESKKPSQQVTGFVEIFDERFFAYYTCETSALAQKRIARWVHSPDLDYTWFSSPLLMALWEKDVATSGSDRFSKLVFRYESIFDMPGDFSMCGSTDSEDDDEEDTVDGIEEEVGEEKCEYERRKARFEMSDRIGKIRASLASLQQNYDPLNALYALRIPNHAGRGGNDLYQNGQVTNRTDSFEAHRNAVRYLYRIYHSVLVTTEQSAWPAATPQPSYGTGAKGAPLIIRFEEPLSEATFDQWVKMAFQKRNRFKLWGDPIRLGATTVHVYGADRHLWQPINLELTATGLVAILPQGTCGNTFHRLVANVQHYLSPKITVWIGDRKFEDIVSEWHASPEDGHEN